MAGLKWQTVLPEAVKVVNDDDYYRSGKRINASEDDDVISAET